MGKKTNLLKAIFMGDGSASEKIVKILENIKVDTTKKLMF